MKRILLSVFIPLIGLAYVVGVLLAGIAFGNAVLIGWAGWRGEGAFMVGTLLVFAAWIGVPALAWQIWQGTKEEK